MSTTDNPERFPWVPLGTDPCCCQVLCDSGTCSGDMVKAIGMKRVKEIKAAGFEWKIHFVAAADAAYKRQYWDGSKYVQVDLELHLVADVEHIFSAQMNQQCTKSYTATLFSRTTGTELSFATSPPSIVSFDRTRSTPNGINFSYNIKCTDPTADVPTYCLQGFKPSLAVIGYDIQIVPLSVFNGTHKINLGTPVWDNPDFSLPGDTPDYYVQLFSTAGANALAGTVTLSGSVSRTDTLLASAP